MFGKVRRKEEVSPEQMEIINRKHQVILDRIALVNKLRKDSRYRHINFFEHFAKDLISNNSTSP